MIHFRTLFDNLVGERELASATARPAPVDPAPARAVIEERP